MTLKFELPDDIEQALRLRAAQCGEDIDVLLRCMVIEGSAQRVTNDNLVIERQLPGFGTLFPAKEYAVGMSSGVTF